MKGIRHIKCVDGFALLAVVFFIVIVSALVSLSNNLVSNQIRMTSSIFLRTQAYFAASSGISWASSYTLNNVGCPPNATGTVGIFTVQVKCTQAGPYSDPGQSDFLLYSVTSIASTGTYSKTGYTAKRLTQTFISRKTS